MDTEHEFLQSILEEPDDIDLRLVMADWYESQDNPRGEFIRTQLALDKLPARHPWRKEMTDRESELLRTNRKSWDRPLYQALNRTSLKGLIHKRRAPIRGWKYKRGFCEFITLDAATLLEFHEPIFQLGPIRGIKLLNVGKQLAKVLALLKNKRLTSLDFSDNALGSQLIQAISRWPAAKNLLELNLAGNNIYQFQSLLDATNLDSLTKLIISRNSTITKDIELRLLAKFGMAVQHENGTSIDPGVADLTSKVVQKAFDIETVSYDDSANYEQGYAHHSEEGNDEEDYWREDTREREPESDDSILEGYGYEQQEFDEEDEW